MAKEGEDADVKGQDEGLVQAEKDEGALRSDIGLRSDRRSLHHRRAVLVKGDLDINHGRSSDAGDGPEGLDAAGEGVSWHLRDGADFEGEEVGDE